MDPMPSEGGDMGELGWRLHCRCGRNACAVDRVDVAAIATLLRPSRFALLACRIKKGSPTRATGDVQMQCRCRPGRMREAQWGSHAASDRVESFCVHHMLEKEGCGEAIGLQLMSRRPSLCGRKRMRIARLICELKKDIMSYDMKGRPAPPHWTGRTGRRLGISSSMFCGPRSRCHEPEELEM